MRKCREWISLNFLILCPFPLHFLILSPFPLHFLILIPFSPSPAATSCATLVWGVFLVGTSNISDYSEKTTRTPGPWYSPCKKASASFFLIGKTGRACQNHPVLVVEGMARRFLLITRFKISGDETHQAGDKGIHCQSFGTWCSINAGLHNNLIFWDKTIIKS